MNNSPIRVALFDFDQTFYKHETFSILMKHLKQVEPFNQHYSKFFRPTLFPFILYRLKLLSGEKMRAKAMQYYLRALDGATEKEVRLFFNKLYSPIQQGIHPQLAQLLKEYHAHGITTVLVSGAFTPFLEEVTKDYPFDYILGSDIPMKEGKIDAVQSITHVQADLKVDALKEKLQGKTIDFENSFAFSDRYSDLPMLTLVGNPVAVNPEESLRIHAEKNNWLIIE